MGHDCLHQYISPKEPVDSDFCFPTPTGYGNVSRNPGPTLSGFNQMHKYVRC